MYTGKIFLISLFLSLSLGQFGRLPLGSEGVNIYLTDLLLLGGSFMIFLFLLLSGRSVEIPRRARFLLLFLAVASCSLIWGARELSLTNFMVSSFYFIRLMALSLLPIVVYNLVRSQPEFLPLVSQCLRILFLTCFILTITGFIQIIVFPDFTKLDPALGWDPHQNRLAGTFFDPNFLGAFLVMGLMLVLSLMKERVVLSRKASLFLFATLFVGVVLTFSRSSYLMLAVSLLVYGLFRSRQILLMGFLAFLLAYLFIPRVQTRLAGGVDPDDSARARFVSWGKTLEVIQSAPLTGVGFNAYRYAQDRLGLFGKGQGLGGRAGAGADSSLLFVWATTGLIGFLAFLLFLLDCCLCFWRLARSSIPLNQALGMALLSLLIGLFIESNFINSLFYPAILIVFLILVGLSYALETQV